MLQPYPDGVTSRRTTAMAGLVRARACRDDAGEVDRALLAGRGAGEARGCRRRARASFSTSFELLADPAERRRQADAGRAFYDRWFDVRHTVAALAVMSVKTAVKRLAYAVAPRLAVAVQASRARRRSHRLLKEWGLWDLNQRLVAELGSQVLDGPFAGLTLSALTTRRAHRPVSAGPIRGRAARHMEPAAAARLQRVRRRRREFRLLRGRSGAPVSEQESRGVRRRLVGAQGGRRDVRGQRHRERLDRIVVRSVLAGAASQGQFTDHQRLRGVRGRVVLRADGCPHSPAARSSSNCTRRSCLASPSDAARCSPIPTPRRSWIRAVNCRSNVRPASFTDDEMRRVSTEPRGPQQWLVLTPLAPAVGI